MDQINSYVDAMFAKLPNTRAVEEMKQNILENMQERYSELLSEGKTENEALGAVISQFGNIDEVKKELGIDDMAQQANASAENSSFHIGIVSFVPTFFFPPLFLYFIIKYKEWISALILLWCSFSLSCHGFYAKFMASGVGCVPNFLPCNDCSFGAGRIKKQGKRVRYYDIKISMKKTAVGFLPNCCFYMICMDLLIFSYEHFFNRSDKHFVIIFVRITGTVNAGV